MHGRIRPIIGINDRLFARRSFAQRAAVNTRVQGSAADIMKIAMINTQRKLKKISAQSKILIQVHDELVFDVPKNEIKSIVPLIKAEMETAIRLDVPLTVDVDYGPNWLDLDQSL
jgi:DNA polymerase-1